MAFVKSEVLCAEGRRFVSRNFYYDLLGRKQAGLNTMLPYGLRRVKAMRMLTTESAAILIPFRVQEIQAPAVCPTVQTPSPKTS